MGHMLNDVEHLSREIGPRPAGTEEERVAAMYLAENFQKRSGLPFKIEDFEGARGRNKVYNFIAIVSALLFFVSMILTVVTVPMFIITLILAAIIILEMFDRPVISNFLRYGISQNVVAKYTPSYGTNNPQAMRKRKVVIVSHYDSGRAVSGPTDSYFKVGKLLRVASIVICCLIPIILLIKGIAFPQTSGGSTLFFLILAIIIGLVAISPALLDFYESRQLYNEAANCNASGSAALIELARLLGTGAYNMDEDQQSSQSTPVVHGQVSAQASNVVPEGANLSYDKTATAGQDKTSVDPLEQKEQSLADAKAAVAAFTAPRKPRTQYDDEGNVVKASSESVDHQAETKNNNLQKVVIDDASADRAAASKDKTPNMPSYKRPETKGEVPSWFKSAQSKAKVQKNGDKDEERIQGQRSRFAHTVDYMQQKKEAEVEAQRKKDEEEREKLRQKIIEANKAAEEERKKQFGDEKPFFVNEEEKSQEAIKQEPKQEIKEQNKQETGDAQTTAEPIKEKQEMSIDESFKMHQQNNAPAVATEKEHPAEKEQPEQKMEIEEPPQKIGFAPKEETPQPAQATPVQNAAVAPQPVQTVGEEADKTMAMPSPAQTNKQPKVLPENSGPINLDQMQQYAPLDDQEFISSNQMPENSSMIELPEVFTNTGDIESDPQYQEALNQAPAGDNANDQSFERGKFGTGSFAAVSESEGVAGATGTFAPVTEELIEDASKSGQIGEAGMVVEDADDSVYGEGSFTDTGAFAGRDYVDMPSEKRKGLFGLFSRKDKAGKHSNKDISFDDIAPDDSGDNIIDDNAWNGGAFSIKDRLANIGANKAKAPVEDEEIYDQEPPAENNQYYDDSFQQPSNAPITSDEHRINSMLDPVPDFDEQIQDFHNTSINIEVWMVALGSEVNENSGIQAFLMEHAQELSGAIIVDIEALGAGNLSLINSEGMIRKSKTASRLKRYVRQASNKLGMTIPSIDVPWGSSSASYANKLGFRTIRLAGMNGGKPAFYMEKDDVVENIDEATLQQNVKYLLELIQCI